MLTRSFECVLQADIVLTFEDTLQAWSESGPWGRHRRCAAMPKAAVVVHGTGHLSREHIKHHLRHAQQLGASYAYLTDASMPNPWGRLPSYWHEEVAAVSELNDELCS